MNLNRRTFFQAAALLPVAVLQSKGRTIPPQEAAKPAVVEVDLAEPGAAEYIGRHETDLFVRLEEMDPADLSELTGAILRIGDSGENVCILATMGDTLQREGHRTSHLLGLISQPLVAAIASHNPRNPEDGFIARFPDSQDRQSRSPLQLQLFAGEAPELGLYISSHCLGMLRGELLLRFFDCLRKRSARGDARTF